MVERKIKTYTEFSKKVHEYVDKYLPEGGVECDYVLSIDDKDARAVLTAVHIAKGCSVDSMGALLSLLVGQFTGYEMPTQYDFAWYLYKNLRDEQLELLLKAVMVTNIEVIKEFHERLGISLVDVAELVAKKKATEV